MNGPTRTVRPSSPSPSTTVCPGSMPSALPASIVTVDSKPNADPLAETRAGTVG